jgi:hypothetical protein
LVLRSKTRNHHGNFDAQITKLELSILRPNQKKTVATSFEVKLEKTIATSFKDKLEKTVATGFKAKLVKTVRTILRSNHSQTVDIGFEAQPRNPRS